MINVLPSHDPPIERVTLSGHLEEVFSVKSRICHRCASFVAEEIVHNSNDDDEVTVTIVLFPGNNLDKKAVERIMKEQSATDINIKYNSNGGEHEGAENDRG